MAADAGSPEERVIAPQQEALLRRLLGFGQPPIGAGCVVESAAVERVFARARYTCRDGTKPAVELHHPLARPEASLRTEKFAVVSGTPLAPAFASAFAARLRALETGWAWTAGAPPDGGALPAAASAAQVAGASAAAVDVAGSGSIAKPGQVVPLGEFGGSTPDGGIAPREQVVAADQARYGEGLELYRTKKFEAAFVLFLELAGRKSRYPGALGMTAASLACLFPDDARLRGHLATAQARPDDPLAQFVAGIASLYSAHNGQPAAEEKRRLYGDTVRYLERAREAFKDEARLYVYLAVGHYRLGLQAQAETLIERALALGSADPEVHYAQSELYQRKEPARSLAALEQYQRRMEAISRSGGVAPVATSKKAQRVESLLAHLRAVVAGKAEPRDLWDSVEHLRGLVPGGHEDHPHPHPRSPGMVISIVAGAVGLIVALVIAVRARRRRRDPAPPPGSGA